MMQGEAKGLVSQNNLITVPVTVASDNWVSIPLTSEVRDLLSGAVANTGFMLTSEGPGAFTFATGNAMPGIRKSINTTSGLLSPDDYQWDGGWSTPTSRLMELSGK